MGARMSDMRLLMACVLSAAIGASGVACSRDSSAPKPAAPPASDAARPALASGDYANGLTVEERRQFYHLSEGGELYPADWLLALEATVTDASGASQTRPFLETLDRFG